MRERPEETSGTKPNAPKSQDSRRTEAEPASCGDGERRFALARESWVGWRALKTGNQKVDGKFQVASELSLAGDSVEGLSFRVVFDVDSLSTENDLRDQRIADILFGKKSGEALAFEVTSVRGKDGNDDLPATGKSRVYALEGEIEIAGSALPMSVDVTVSTESDGSLAIKPKGRLKLLPRTDLGIADRLDELLDVGKTSLAEEFVSISFDLTATEVCTDQ